MVVPAWCLPVSLALFGIIMSFWGWVAMKIIEQGRKLVELDVRLGSQVKISDEHLAWLKKMESKLMEVAENTANILGKLDTEVAKNTAAILAKLDIDREGEEDE